MKEAELSKKAQEEKQLRDQKASSMELREALRVFFDGYSDPEFHSAEQIYQIEKRNYILQTTKRALWSS